MNVAAVTRLELVDHTDCPTCLGKGYMRLDTQPNNNFECPNCHGAGSPGREVLFSAPHKQIELSLQDGGKTLKIFLNDRAEDGN